MPFTLCVFRSITTLFHTLNHSGWWFIASATRATRVILPNAVTKSLHANSRCSLPFTTLHPLALGSSSVISGSDSFFAGILHPSGTSWHLAKPLCGASLAPATLSSSTRANRRRFECWEWFFVECTREFHYRRGFL